MVEERAVLRWFLSVHHSFLGYHVFLDAVDKRRHFFDCQEGLIDCHDEDTLRWATSGEKTNVTNELLPSRQVVL